MCCPSVRRSRETRGWKIIPYELLLSQHGLRVGRSARFPRVARLGASGLSVRGSARLSASAPLRTGGDGQAGRAKAVCSSPSIV